MVKNTFLGLLTSFLSKIRANSLLLSADSTGRNLLKSLIIGQVPKKISKMSDSDINWFPRFKSLKLSARTSVGKVCYLIPRHVSEKADSDTSTLQSKL